jgi:16S rRNA processing protein RimM
VTLARVVKTQGRRGEVAVEVHTDVPDRIVPGLRLFALQTFALPNFALPNNDARRELLVEEVWPHKDWLVLKFVGVDSISEAETLLRCELQVPRSERGKLEEGWTFISDLIGCDVCDRDREIGKVQDVRFGAGEAPLLVVTAQSKEYEVPYAEAYLKSVDLGNKRIVMALPEGLLEVNAPLKQEKKNQEKRKR